MTDKRFIGADLQALYSLWSDVKAIVEVWAVRSNDGAAVWFVAGAVFEEMNDWTLGTINGQLFVKTDRVEQLLAEIAKKAADLDVTAACDKLRAALHVRP